MSQQTKFEATIHCYHLIGGKHAGKTIAYITVNPRDFLLKDGKYILKQSIRNRITLVSEEPFDEFGWTFVSPDELSSRITNLTVVAEQVRREINKIENPMKI